MLNSKFIPLILIFWGMVLGVYLYFFRSTSVASISPNGTSKNQISKTNASPCQIIALGDSITAGYELATEKAYPAQLEAILQKNGHPCRVINAGVSGDTSKWLLERIEFTLSDTPYQLAILTIGGNDGLRNLPIEDLNTNIREIIAKLQTKNIPVLLSGMQIPNNAGGYATEFKNVYPIIAKDLSIPLFPFFLEGVAMNTELNLPDGIHPNAEGYRVIAENIYTFMGQSQLLKLIPKN